MRERRAARQRSGGLPTRTLLCLLPCLWPAGLAGAADTKDPAATAARTRLQAALDQLNPGGGILDDGDGTGRSKNRNRNREGN